MATSKGSSKSSVTFEEKEAGSMVCKYLNCYKYLFIECMHGMIGSVNLLNL